MKQDIPLPRQPEGYVPGEQGARKREFVLFSKILCTPVA